MTAFRILIAASVVGLWPAGAVSAQADRASTADGVLSAEKVPNTTAVGQTKPPSRDASPTAVKPIERPTAEQASEDAVVGRVCVGCRTEPAAVDPLSLKIRPSATPERRADPPDAPGGQSEARQTIGEPRQQADLDTVALASAHRERAESVQEKTTGLWQSWLVSVCEGCGDQKPARALKLNDWPLRDNPAATGSIGRAARPVAAHPDAKPATPRRSLEADLSPENVDAIRRMPQR